MEGSEGNGREGTGCGNGKGKRWVRKRKGSEGKCGGKRREEKIRNGTREWKG